MKRTRSQSEREPTTALINIVFLILIFFMVTGTLAAPPLTAPDYTTSEDGECCSPPDALIVMADGTMSYEGRSIGSPADYLEAIGPDAPARLLPDKALPAKELLRLTRLLREAGADRIILMTENTPQ